MLPGKNSNLSSSSEGTGEMSCKDTIHLICWYLEGKLSPSVSRDIEEHLHDCANCKLVLKAATRTLDQYFEPVRNETTTHAA